MKCNPQQFINRVVSEGFFCGNSAESVAETSRNLPQRIRFIVSGKGAESSAESFRGNFAEIFGNLSAMTPSRTTP